MADTLKPLERCHSDDCDGLNEVVKLLPSGGLWDISRDTSLSRHMKALGHAKSCINQRICQEFNESDPCKSVRLFDYWANRFGLPSCFPRTQEALCDWIDLINDDSCPVGSVGFLRKAVSLAIPEATFSHNLDCPSFGCMPCCDTTSQAPFVISAPPELFYYEELCCYKSVPPQDGVNANRFYFIPELDCLKHEVFPVGFAVSAVTNPQGANGEPVFGVPEENLGESKFPFYC